MRNDSNYGTEAASPADCDRGYSYMMGLLEHQGLIWDLNAALKRDIKSLHCKIEKLTFTEKTTSITVFLSGLDTDTSFHG